MNEAAEQRYGERPTLAAAIAARALHLRAVVLDAGSRPGGQLLANDTPILDCPGLDVATGSELGVRLQQHVERLGGHVRVNATVERIDVDGGAVELAGERPPAPSPRSRRSRARRCASGRRGATAR